jgi:hypothetical protein
VYGEVERDGKVPYSVGWCAMAVKLDLEPNGELVYDRSAKNACYRASLSQAFDGESWHVKRLTIPEEKSNTVFEAECEAVVGSDGVTHVALNMRPVATDDKGD